jgi:hypothetical protein
MTYNHFDVCRLRVDGDVTVVAKEGSSLRYPQTTRQTIWTFVSIYHRHDHLADIRPVEFVLEIIFRRYERCF